MCCESFTKWLGFQKRTSGAKARSDWKQLVHAFKSCPFEERKFPELSSGAKPISQPTVNVRAEAGPPEEITQDDRRPEANRTFLLCTNRTFSLCADTHFAAIDRCGGSG